MECLVAVQAQHSQVVRLFFSPRWIAVVVDLQEVPAGAKLAAVPCSPYRLISNGSPFRALQILAIWHRFQLGASRPFLAYSSAPVIERVFPNALEGKGRECQLVLAGALLPDPPFRLKAPFPGENAEVGTYALRSLHATSAHPNYPFEVVGSDPISGRTGRRFKGSEGKFL